MIDRRDDGIPASIEAAAENIRKLMRIRIRNNRASSHAVGLRSKQPGVEREGGGGGERRLRGRREKGGEREGEVEKGRLWGRSRRWRKWFVEGGRWISGMGVDQARSNHPVECMKTTGRQMERQRKADKQKGV